MTSSWLQSVNSPAELRAVPEDQLPVLAQEIRDFLVEKVAKTGGHLGPNLGVVELTIALHRVFDTPNDVLLWDTGHQAYIHKILTGRQSGFDTLRQAHGLSGYPSRAESSADVIENSHASTALSYADGIAKAYEQRGLLPHRHVVPIIGDGALTGGMAWEALNNIAAAKDRPMVIVVNDNERSYSPTIGGLAHHLTTLRTTHNYERVLDWGKRTLHRTPLVGQPVYGALHGMKKGIKDLMAPQGLFEDLGLKYVGPIDGHNIAEMEHILSRAKNFPGPVVVHVITKKGNGYSPAEQDTAELFHAVGIIDPLTGKPLNPAAPSWTSVFAAELVQLGRERKDIVALTAAMLGPTGLTQFAHEFPDRTFDVGIAEQHAATSAAGMAYGGLHPVVAVYSTFLNRAFDQVLMDCAMHHAGVTFVLDRAGLTGNDGASHNGVWDFAVFQRVPRLRIAAPRDGVTLREELREAVGISDAPTIVRYPKGEVPAALPALRVEHDADIIFETPRRLAETATGRVLIVAIGAMATTACQVAEQLQERGLAVTVLDPRWVKPLPRGVITQASAHDLVVTMEDGLRQGGVGTSVAELLRESGVTQPVEIFGTPGEFLPHASRSELLEDCGLTATPMAERILAVAFRLPQKLREPKGLHQ